MALSNAGSIEELRAKLSGAQLSEFEKGLELVKGNFVDESMFLHKVYCRVHGLPSNPAEVEAAYAKKHNVVVEGE